MFYESFGNKNAKTTVYYKTGEIKEVVEFSNDKKSKTTFYHKNGEIKNIEKY